MVHLSDSVRLRALACGVLVLALIGIACSGQDDDLVAVDQAPVAGTSSSRITAEVPGDWQLVTAGVGNDKESWRQGCTSSGPYTVVKSSDGARSIKVSASNYRGCSDGLDEISLAFPVGNPEELKVDGRRALLATESEVWEDDRPDLPPGFVDLLVDADDSLAVRAQSTNVQRAELLEVASLAILDDDLRVAPHFGHLPKGLRWWVGRRNGGPGHATVLLSWHQPGPRRRSNPHAWLDVGTGRFRLAQLSRGWRFGGSAGNHQL